MNRERHPFCAAAVAALIAAAATLTGCMTTGSGQVVEDPQGRFTYLAAADLQPQLTDGSYDHYMLESPPMEVYVVAVEAPSEQSGRELAFDRIGRNFTALKFGGTTSFGEWRADAFSTDTVGEWAGIAYQRRGDTLYGMVVFGGSETSADTLPGPVAKIIGSFQFSDSAGEVFRPTSFPELEEFIDRTVASFGGSLSLAAVKNGEVVYRYAAGDRGKGLQSSPEVVYHQGSKIVTASAVMQQVQQGRIDLDARLDTYFPEFPLGSRIKVRNLLTHSAGLPTFEDGHLVAFGRNEMPDMGSVLESYWPMVSGLLYDPGSHSSYNNWNFLILARLLEKVSGEALTSYVRRHIFEPAGLRHTVYTTADLGGEPEALAVVAAERIPSTTFILSAGGLETEGFVAYRARAFAHLQPFDILPCWAGVKSTAEEAALFGWMFVNGGRIAYHSILERSTVREMLRMQESQDGRPLGMGLAWQLGRQGRESFVEHGGGGTGIESLLRIYPKRGLSIAVLGNANGYGPEKVVEYTDALLAR